MGEQEGAGMMLAGGGAKEEGRHAVVRRWRAYSLGRGWVLKESIFRYDEVDLKSGH
jgi:hypothetical protein